MPDLYAILGVDRTASLSEIRKAYRMAAKKAHPDTGGSPERFALVKLAYDVLSDPLRRKQYDDTGEAEAKPVDNELSEALQEIYASLDFVLNECGRKDMEPSEIDLVADMRKTLEIKLDQVRQSLANPKSALRKLKKLSGRFKVKDKTQTNFLEQFVAGKIGQLEAHLSQVEHQIKKLEYAIRFIKTYDFDWGGGYGSSKPVGMQLLLNQAARGLS